MSASRPNLRRTASVPLALAVCIVVAACGGGGGHKNNTAANAPKLTPTALVSKAFDASDAVDSGNISLTATINLDGLKQLDGKPIVLALSGPFQRTAGKTSADFAATISIGSSTAHLGVDVLPGHDYLGIDGTFYDLPTGAGSTLGSLTGGSSGAAGPATGATGLLSSLGIDPHSWLTNPKIVGDTTIGGVQTQHLTAQVDIAKVLGDLEKVIGASGATGSSGTSSITSALPLIESAINSAKVDIYTGVSDHILRRFDLAIAFTVPAIAASEFGGLKGGSLSFDVTLTELGKAETISAPANVQPAKDLLNGIFSLESKFGSLASLFSSASSSLGSGGGLGSLFNGSSSGG
ncbi:MAG TPA: hypothetical protein VKS25_04130 [Solirubrobacteraceae bacterium]|nr:hypothetical protein [Solirubrobacteraceae bacterium]